MLTFFTDPYKDEILYSAIARYHYYVGNIDLKDTLREVFGDDSAIPSLEICSHLEFLANNLGRKYTSDNLINNHTIFPFYAPFLPKARNEELINDMKFRDGKGLYAKVGLLAGGICKKEGIYYCPICSKKEIEVYGEAFIHREHQLQGVFVCPHNEAKLKKYEIDKTIASRVEFIRLDEKLLDFNVEYEESEDIHKKLLKASKGAYYILTNNLSSFDKEVILKKYKELLYEKGLVSVNKNIKQRELSEEFINFYGKEFLEIMGSSIDESNEYNWLKVITRNVKRTVHPIRHILLINFLVNDIKPFFEIKKNNYNPFGKSPWPCLNPVAEHYKNDVIKDLKITPDYKTRLPVGTFTCNCGFIYSRKGPDKAFNDRYKIGRIKEFGQVWENKLKEYLQEGNCGFREIARIMKCDPKTIIKFDKSLGVNYFKACDSINQETKNIEKEKINIDIDTYKQKILEVVIENPNCSRTQIRQLCKKEYIYLYRNDKSWILESLPQNINRRNIDYKSDKRVDWDKRDIEILEVVTNEYKDLISKEKPIRITKSIIGKELGILPILEKKLDKLPKTKEYLDNIIEDVEAFQLRRSMLIIDKKLENKDSIRLWELQRLTGIRNEAFNKLAPKLENYIDRGYKH